MVKKEDLINEAPSRITNDKNTLNIGIITNFRLFLHKLLSTILEQKEILKLNTL